MILLAFLFAINLMFAVLPPYGLLTVLNAAAAVGALALMIATAREG